MSQIYLMDKKTLKAFKSHVTPDMIRERYKVKDLVKIDREDLPDVSELTEWNREGGCECCGPCACWIEPDGECAEGFPSWLRILGYI